MIRPAILCLITLVTCATACGGELPKAQAPAAPTNVFALAVPSVVAILNDDEKIREGEAQNTLRELGMTAEAPKKIVDVSLRKTPMPHGTGFYVEGGRVVTAAHVIQTPDHLKITTRTGQTVDADLEKIDELRDVAVLKPRTALKDVPFITLAAKEPEAGRRVWALGHTGNGLWALSWGISEGITSGVVDMLGTKLMLFDAPVYPGFSGGPVVVMENGKPEVVGVNHAILFTGGAMTVASISSAATISDVRATIAGTPSDIQKQLTAYAKEQSQKLRAELFVTKNLSVHRDKNMLTTAAIMGNDRTIEASEDMARVPVVGMFFGLPKGDAEVTFEIQDPSDKTVTTLKHSVRVREHERVGFATADFRFDPKSTGRYDILAKIDGKVIGRTDVWIEDPDDDDQPIDDEESDLEGGEPTVSVVVASGGREDPFALVGVRAGWSEWRYPRRVGFTWFARGSRGWSGSNVAITAWVLDSAGTIVGRGVGCVRPEVRPEHPWSCMGSGGSPLVQKEGKYDVVFTMNDRPIGIWPMEAMVRTQQPSAFEKWVKDMQKGRTLKHPSKPKAAPEPTPAPATPGKPGTPAKPTTPAKPGTPAKPPAIAPNNRK